jgi:hypothetical protein
MTTPFPPPFLLRRKVILSFETEHPPGKIIKNY